MGVTSHVDHGGAEAIDAFSAFKLDVVFLDLMMPNTDGFRRPGNYSANHHRNAQSMSLTRECRPRMSWRGAKPQASTITCVSLQGLKRSRLSCAPSLRTGRPHLIGIRAECPSLLFGDLLN